MPPKSPFHVTPPAPATVAALLLALTTTGCPPVREDVGEGEASGEFLESAFVALDPYTGTDYALAYVYLVDTTHNCESIVSNWGLAWWNMSSDVTWVQANVYRGQFVDWASTFRSQYQWNLDGEFDYTQADFFSGTYGTGGYDYPYEDDDVPPPPDPADDRAQEGSIGADIAGADDALIISSWSDETVRGTLRTAAGDWSFEAINCGNFGGGPIGVGGEDGDDGGDAGGGTPNATR